MHHNFISVIKINFFQFLKQKPDFIDFCFWSQKYQSFKNCNFISFMFIHSLFPHHVDLCLSNFVVCIQKVKQEMTLFDYLRVQRFPEKHVKNRIRVKPLHKYLLSEPFLTQAIKSAYMTALRFFWLNLINLARKNRMTYEFFLKNWHLKTS